MRIEISNLEPMGAVRTTQKMAGRTTSGQKYAAYKDVIGWEIKKHIQEPLTQAIGVRSIVFHMPIPKSKQGHVKPGDLHTVKPDIDNLIKGLFDAVNGVAWIDDNRVAEIGRVRKVYSMHPGIVFEIEEIGGLSYGQKEKPEPTQKAKQKAERRETSRARRGVRTRI